MEYIKQVTLEDVQREPETFSTHDIGRWQIVLNKECNGIWNTREEAQYCFYSLFVR